MKFYSLKTATKSFLFLACLGTLSTTIKAELLAEQPKTSSNEYSYEDIKQKFNEATSSQNQSHVRDILLTPAERELIEQAAQNELRLRISKDKTGKLAQSPEEQKMGYQQLIKESYQAAIKRQVDLFSKLLDISAMNQAPVFEAPTSAAHEEHFFLDIRVSKGNFNSELINVPQVVFGPHVQTLSGKAKIAHKIYNPSTSIPKIQASQRQIVWFLQHPEIMREAKKLLTEIASLEKEWISGWLLEKVNVYKLIFGTKEESIAEQKKFNLNDWFYGKSLTQQDRATAGGTFGLSLIYRAIAKKVFEKSNPGMHLQYFIQNELPFFMPFILPTIACLAFLSFYGIASTIANLDNSALTPANVFKILVLVAFGLTGAYSLALTPFFLILLPIIKPAMSRKRQSVDKIQETLMKIRMMSELSLRLRELLPTELFPALNQIDQFFNASQDRELQKLFNNLKTATFNSKAGVFSYRGRVIRTFKMYDEQKAKFGALMGIVGELDACLAAAELVQKPKANGNGFCLVQLVDSPDIQFNCQGMWDPFIDPAQAIANNLSLGKAAAGSDGACGVLLSGPNYGGKSVFLRGMITTAVLAQSFGIAPAKSLKMTPMDCFDTYINVQDDTTAKESLFSAEMKRAESLLKSIENAARTNKKVFVVADELLTGTKPTYASALVRSIIEKVSTFDNVICIFASHFDNVINNVKRDTKGLFKQMYVGAKTDAQGFFAGPTYKINNGVSPVDSAFFVAKQKLAKEHHSVVERAKEILLAEALEAAPAKIPLPKEPAVKIVAQAEDAQDDDFTAKEIAAAAAA